MTAYMGPGLGSLVPVRCLSVLSVQPQDRAATTDGMSGTRIYVDPPTRPTLRTWSCQISVSDPEEVGTLFELASLRQALWMISDAAAAENILPPASSHGPHGWHNGTLGGPVTLAGDGVAGTSIQVSGTAYSPLFPVVPGVPVSGVVNVRALSGSTGRVFLDWMPLGAPQNGAATATAASASTGTTAAPLPALSFAATPPANVHVARLRFTGVSQVARPAVRWQPSTDKWRPGGGAEAVYLPPPSQDVILTTGDRALSSYSYTVTEVTQ